MHPQTPVLAGLNERPADPWTLLTGGSVAIVAGFIADLLRLGVHVARQMVAAGSGRRHDASCDWQRPCTSHR